MQRRLRHADDREEGILGTHRRPGERAALRVSVDQEHAVPGERKRVREVDGDRRLADAAFLVEHADDHARSRFQKSANTLSRFCDDRQPMPRRRGSIGSMPSHIHHRLCSGRALSLGWEAERAGE